MNMLADADLPEADDEFSYREDSRDALLAHLFRDGVPGLARHRSPREPGLLPPVFQRNPVIPLPRTVGPLEEYAIDHPYRPGRFETRDPAPLPKRVVPKGDVPLRQCPVCRAFGVLSAVLSKMPGRSS